MVAARDRDQQCARPEARRLKEKDPKKIARSLKASADHSERRKSDPYRSAMSMLTFYINRAGDTLPKEQKKHLEDAKDELRALYDKPAREKK